MPKKYTFDFPMLFSHIISETLLQQQKKNTGIITLNTSVILYDHMEFLCHQNLWLLNPIFYQVTDSRDDGGDGGREEKGPAEGSTHDHTLTPLSLTWDSKL